MKKLLVSGSIASLLLPILAFAAYNDVSLTTDTVLDIGGITVNVSGDTATVESIAVGAASFTVTLQGNANSSFQVTAPNLNKLVTNQQSGISVDACSGLKSVLGYTASSSEVIAIITPSATLCSSPAADTSGGTGSSRGGGGGSTPAPQASPVAVVVTGTDFSSLTPAEKRVLIAQVRTQLASLIQQLISLLIAELQQQISEAQAAGSY